jgi:chitodextrinase
MNRPVAGSLLALSLLAAPCSAAVHHFVFGLPPGSTYDVRQGADIVVTGLVPGPADEIVFSAPAASPIAIYPSGELGDVTPPSTVANLTVTTTTPSSETLAWTAVGDDGLNGQAATYDLRYSTSPITPSSWESAIAVSGEPSPRPAGQGESFTVTGLSPGTLYYFGLKVADEMPNWSGLSNIASGTTPLPPDTTPPAAVANLGVTSTTATSARLVWTAVGDDGQTGRAATYDLRYATSPIDASNWAEAVRVAGEPAPMPAGQAESFTVTGLSPGTRYYFALKVADEVPNWSGLSNVPSAVTLAGDTTPPANVTTLATLSETAQSITLAWTAVGDDDQTGQATTYDLRYATSPIDASNWSAATRVSGEPAPKAAGQGEGFTVSGLAPSTLYYFAMTVLDEVPNSSGISNVASGTTTAPPDGTPPAAIADLAVSTSTPTTVALSWTAPGDDGAVGQATTYDIRYSRNPISNQNWSTATQVTGEPAPKASGQGEAFTVSNLLSRTRYYFGIRALDEVPNQAALSNVVSAKTLRLPDTTPPHGLTDLAALTVDHRAITLGWTAPMDDDGDSVAVYEGRMRAGAIVDEATWDAATPIPNLPIPAMPGIAESASVPGLSPATGYTFAIRARDEEGNLAPIGSTTTVSTTSAPDTLPPDRIADLTAADPTQNAVKLRWRAPADRVPEDCVQTPEVDRYEIRFALVPLDGDGWTAGHPVPPPDPAAPGAVQEVVATGLTPDTRYYFAMRTCDARGLWSETSNIVEQATQPNDQLPDMIPPGEIRELTLVSTEPTAADLAWIAPGGDGLEGIADHYEVRRSNEPLVADKWDSGVPVLPPMPCGAAGTRETLRVDGLDSATSYYFALRAIDGAGNAGPISGSLPVRTLEMPDVSAPAPVTDLAAVAADTSSITLRWTAPADDGGRCAAYDLRMSGASIDEASWDGATTVETPPAPSIPGETDSVRVSGLAAGMRLAFALRTRDGAGNLSAISNLVWAETDTVPDGPAHSADRTSPARVEDLAATALGPTSVQLAWTAVGDDGLLGTAAAYDLRRSPAPIDSAGWDASISVEVSITPGLPGGAETMTVSGLAPDADHHFAVRVRDEAGNLSAVSVDAWTRTPRQEDTSPPSILAPPIAAGVEDRIEVAWTASIDPDVVEYCLYRRDLAGGDRIQIDGLHELSYIDHSVEPERTYAYAVAARDASGNLSAPSAEAQAGVSLDAFLPVISQLDVEPAALDTACAGGVCNVRLSWSVASLDRCAGFEIARSDDHGTSWLPRTTVPLGGTGSFRFEETIPPGDYLYRISAVSPRGYERHFEPIPVAWTLHPYGPASTTIGEPFPNPSRGRFELPLTLGRQGPVRVVVHDASGRTLRVLYDGDEEAGPHRYAWEGPAAASGVYWVRIETEDRAVARKLTVRK